MPRIKLVIAYDGTHYVGYQLQQNGPSVQGRLQIALNELLGEVVMIEAAGRTDSGVHAEGQVVAFTTTRTFPLKAYWMGLNGLLPEDVSIIRAEEVDDKFDPRRQSRGKRYIYRVSNRRTRLPQRRFTHWEIFQPLNMATMIEASKHLLGEHDFSAFRAADCEASHAIREIRRIEITGRPGDELVIEVEGTAFLKHMVRNITGTLIEVGRGKQPPSWVGDVLRSKDRHIAGPTAPPQGLTLQEVFYAPSGNLSGP